MREMKDSGIAWAPSIPKEWTVLRGKYVFNCLHKPVQENDRVVTCFRDGEVTLRQKRREEGFTIAEKEIGYQGIDVGDLVVHGMDGFAGAIGISDSRGKASPVLNVLDTIQNKRYMMYYLRSMAYNDVFIATATGIRVRSCDLRWNKLAEIVYPIPSIKEQNTIVACLEENCRLLDAFIINQEQQIEKLKAYKQSLITEVVTKGLNPDAPTKPSGVEWIGEINLDYLPYRLKDILKKEKNAIRVGPFGSALKGSDIISEGTYWVYNQRVVLDQNFTQTNTYVADKKYFELKEFEVLSGDVLCTTRGSIGKIAKVPENCPNGILHPCIIRFRINPELVLYNLLELIFNHSNIVIGQLKDMSNATTIDVVYSDSLKQVVIPLGTMQQQQQLYDYLLPRCAKIDRLIEIKQQKIAKLTEYKKSLIYEYVTGKKEVL